MIFLFFLLDIKLSNEIILSAVAEARRSIETAVNDTIASLFSRDHASTTTLAKLVRLTRFPNADEARDVVQAAEVYEHALTIIQQHLGEGYAFNTSGENISLGIFHSHMQTHGNTFHWW